MKYFVSDFAEMAPESVGRLTTAEFCRSHTVEFMAVTKSLGTRRLVQLPVHGLCMVCGEASAFSVSVEDETEGE